MSDFFLQYSKGMSNENLSMRKAALAAMPSGPVPCVAAAGSTKQRVEIYDPREGKKRKLDPYSANAKELYRFYIQELGFDDTWIAPLDLDFHPSSGRFKKRKQAKQKPAITEKSAYKGYLSCFKLHNYEQQMGEAGFNLIQQFKPQLEKAIAQHGAIKVYPSAYCLFEKVLEGVAYQSDIEFPVSLAPVQVLSSAQLDSALNQMTGAMQQKIPELELRGTGMKLQRVSTIELQMARYKPLKGSSYVPLPEPLAAKKAIVNVQNKDQECFKWAVLSALFPVAKDAQRVGKYTEHHDKLDWSGLNFPVQLDKIALFERRNSISVNVYGCDVKKGQCAPHPLRLSKTAEAKKHIDLLLLEDAGAGSHYCWIKNFSRFAAQNSNRNKAHYCKHCLHGFPSQQKLGEHLQNGCRAITEARPVLPEPGSKEACVEFKNHDKQYKAPFVVYADFEALNRPVSKAERKGDDSYTDAYQTHEPSGFTIFIVSADPARTFKPVVYRGRNTIKEFILKMKEIEQMLMPLIKAVEPIQMSAQDERDFKCAKTCCLCHKPLGKDRVREHDHLTGKYRGAAHSVCNLEEGKKRTRRFEIPVFFHNLKGYDSHMIVSEVGKYTAKLSAIPMNFEKLISFSFSHSKFLDSLGFLTASLDTLVKNLHEGGAGKHKFIHSARHCAKPEHIDMLLKKGVYPYDYMDDWSRMDETELPPKEAFYSRLNESHISDEEYEHAKQVWNTFDCKHLGDYHDLYMLTDVLLLADVFESFRDLSLTAYGLDPAHYFTTPNFAWDAMLHKTGVKLELLTDYDQYLMVEQGLRGGIAMISHRHAEANNPEMGDGYDASKEHSYISYLDANNLYGWAMVQPLPEGDFQWEMERDADKLIEQYANNPERGAIVKCDLHYPTELHDSHNDYPLAPERKLVTQDMLSPYAQKMQQQLKIGRDVSEKLVPNLQDKTDYVVDIRNLKFYRDHGLQITKVSKVISFRQSTWMKPYIDFNTEMRKQAKNDFEKDFYKLMCNSCFGKTMENVRNRISMDFVTSNSNWGDHAVKLDRTVERKIASPLYDGHMIYNEDLAAIKMKKKEITLNKPIYAGMSILDLSKLHMYRFHYDVMKQHYGSKAKLLFTDTDSLCYLIQTQNVFEDQKARSELFDLSNYPDGPYKDNTNKKVLGKFKDECEGKSPCEFIGLRPKMYSLKCGKDEKKTAKGVKSAYAKTHIRHADYRRCLLTDDPNHDPQQKAKFNVMRSRRHINQSLEIQKVGLCCYDNKRYLLDDGITSYSYGHYKIGA